MNTEQPNRWLSKVQQLVKGVEFYFPNDDRNPAPGRFAVVGPTSEVAESGTSIEHAAMVFLSTFCGDEDARLAAAALTSRR